MDTIMYASYGAFRANIAQDARQVNQQGSIETLRHVSYCFKSPHVAMALSSASTFRATWLCYSRALFGAFRVVKRGGISPVGNSAYPTTRNATTASYEASARLVASRPGLRKQTAKPAEMAFVTSGMSLRPARISTNTSEPVASQS